MTYPWQSLGLVQLILEMLVSRADSVEETGGSIDIVAQPVPVLTLQDERLTKALGAKGSEVVPLPGGTTGVAVGHSAAAEIP